MNNDMNDENGFTLVELMIVVGLIAIILSMATLGFSRLSQKYAVESYTKEIYSTLMRSRNDANTTNIPRLVMLAANQIQTGTDADGDGLIDGVPVISPYPRFAINFATSPVVFDRRGLTNNIQTIRITGFGAGASPAMDCVVIAATRINIGSWTGGACVQR